MGTGPDSTTNLVVMDPVVGTDRIDAVVTAQVRPADRQVVDLDVHAKVQHEVELRAVDQDQVVDGGIDSRDDAHQTGAIGAAVVH